jgi:hypothetical protein
MGLNPFSLLNEILYELKCIRTLLEGGKSTLLPPLEEDEDASFVSYTDDLKAFQREVEEDEFFRRSGRHPLPGEKVPGPLDSEGKEWSPLEEEVERD